MIKLTTIETTGWIPAITSMRNPKNSWDRSDSKIEDGMWRIGQNDMKLALGLAKGGPVHAKYRRMINVYVDITAPLYWWPEMDAYRIGVVRNSCSFMHKGTAKPYTINDFSIKNTDIYEVLNDFEKKVYTLKYPYETDEWQYFLSSNGRLYRVYKNGKVIREEYTYTDNYGKGRFRTIPEREATIYQNKEGYFVVKLSGRSQDHIMLHRMIAEIWCDKPEGCTQVNHIDGDKGNNSAENLEWVTPSENMIKSFKNGTHDNVSSLHSKYLRWKNSSRCIKPDDRVSFSIDCEKGLTYKELAAKYGITPEQANNSRYIMQHSENEELFNECYMWERLISYLNSMRELYVETKDDNVFRDIRALMPQGYMQKSTLMINYEVLHNIYFSRKDHKLDEWHAFCDWIETLPYSELITQKESGIE